MPCWKQIKTTSLSFTTHRVLIILITIFHLVSTPDKENLKKVHRLATGGHKDINCSEELFNIYEMEQRNNWDGADSVYDAWLLSSNTPKMVSLQEVYNYVFRMGNTKVTYIQQRELGTVFAINTNERWEV